MSSKDASVRFVRHSEPKFERLAQALYDLAAGLDPEIRRRLLAGEPIRRGATSGVSSKKGRAA